MENWTNEPPEKSHGYGLRLVRTPAAGKTVGVITCENLIGCATHFFGGHTVKCTGENCKACHKGVGWRWHGYVSAILSGTSEHVVLEFTDASSNVLSTYVKNNGSLLGVTLNAHRVKGKANGRVIIRLQPTDLTNISLPQTPDIIAILMHVWGLDADHEAVERQIRNSPGFDANYRGDVPDDRVR